VTKRHAELSHLNHFEVLEASESANRNEIHKAFQRAAYEYHPDRLSGEEERLRPLAAAIFRRIAEAYRVLDENESRARYLQTLRPRLPMSPESGEPIGDDPDRVFQAARICLNRGRIEDALVLIRHACRARPNEIQYTALQAWLSVQVSELRSGPEVERALALLTRAVRERSEDLEIRMYRGRVLQRLGRSNEALSDFRYVAQADPKNVDAAREVHLHHVRLSLKPTSASGTFAKIFGR
jgi:curved DNA-binding protein CbpA